MELDRELYNTQTFDKLMGLNNQSLALKKYILNVEPAREKTDIFL